MTAHGHRLGNVEQTKALLTQITEDQAKDIERHERLLYGNGNPGLNTRFHAMESVVQELVESNKRRKANTFQLYLMLVGQIATFLALLLK